MQELCKSFLRNLIRKPFLVFFFIILISFIVLADNIVEPYNDPITFSAGDSRWCKRNGVCTLSTLITDAIITRNLSVIGEVFNVTMNLVTWNITKNFNVGGNLVAKNITANNFFYQNGLSINDTIDKAVLWENLTGETKLKSSQDINMQDGDIKIKDLDGEFHDISRDLQLLDEMNRNTTLTGLNGTLAPDGNVTVTTLSGDNIVVNIDKTESVLNRNSDSIIITSGTNESPILNQIIYVNAGNPVLAKRTTVGLKSPGVATFLQGANYTYVSAIGLATIDNLVGGLFNRFFRDGSTYRSGFDFNVSTNEINISTGVISFLFDEVKIIQNHSTSDLYVHVHSDASFHQHDSLNDCVSYNDGSAVSNNKYFNMVLGIAITHDGKGVMYVTTQDKPSTEYIKAIDAEVDLEDTINFFPPDDIVSLAYIPIVRVVIRLSGGVNTIQTLSNGLLFDDLRGTVTKTSSSPPPSGITSHSDLTNLNLASAGHTRDINLDLNDFNITEADTITTEDIIVEGELLYNILKSSSLIAYYQANNNKSADSSIYENNGTFMNGLTSVKDVFDLDGTDDYVDLGNTQIYDIVGNFTISAWIQTTTSSGVIFGNKRFQGDPLILEGYSFAISNTGQPSLFVGGADNLAMDCIVVDDGTWHQVAVNINATNGLNFYVDGDLCSSPDETTIPNSFTETRPKIGIDNSTDVGSEFFNGLIDNVMFFNRTLEDWEIRVIYDEQNNRFIHVNEIIATENVTSPEIITQKMIFKDHIINVRDRLCLFGQDNNENTESFCFKFNGINNIAMDSTTGVALITWLMGFKLNDLFAVVFGNSNDWALGFDSIDDDLVLRQGSSITPNTNVALRINVNRDWDMGDGNVTMGSILKLSPISLPICSGFNGVAVNTSDNALYYCNSTDWKKVSLT